ncbi:MAG: hypothetical protein D6773_18770 [Alphaproteobacteria bacterium]|nr:MAG: hypothetical protein D6773_18770 [Alphaproteobacteria bacterium]
MSAAASSQKSNLFMGRLFALVSPAADIIMRAHGAGTSCGNRSGRAHDEMRRAMKTCAGVGLASALAFGFWPGSLPVQAAGAGAGAGVVKVSGLGPRCRLLKIGSVSFMDGGRKRGWYFYVSGTRRFANMDVGFEHRDFRNGVLTLEAVGCTPNFLALPIPMPYTLELRLREFPAVREIRVIGSNGAVVRRVPGR